jgi:hypothetical protein
LYLQNFAQNLAIPHPAAKEPMKHRYHLPLGSYVELILKTLCCVEQPQENTLLGSMHIKNYNIFILRIDKKKTHFLRRACFVKPTGLPQRETHKGDTFGIVETTVKCAQAIKIIHH